MKVDCPSKDVLPRTKFGLTAAFMDFLESAEKDNYTIDAEEGMVLVANVEGALFAVQVRLLEPGEHVDAMMVA